MEHNAVARRGEVVDGQGDTLQDVGQLVEAGRVRRPAEALGHALGKALRQR